MTLCWFIIFIILLFIEFITPNLVSIWFAFGAFISIIFSFFISSFNVLFLIFVISSVIFLFVFKKVLKNKKFIKSIPTNVDRFIGKTGIVNKDIDENECGEVIIFGEIWTAKSNKKISTGSKVIVKDIEGVKLIVEEKENV